MDRRSFIQSAFMGSLLLTKLGESAWAQNYSSYDLNTNFKKSYLVNYHLFSYDPEAFLAIYDLDAEKIIKVPVVFDPHTITRVSEDLLVCTEKYGPNAITVDMKKGRIIASKKYTDSDQRQFMGHALYDASRDIILTTEQMMVPEVNHDKFKGVVSVRNPRTLEVISSFDSYGHSPHDLIFTHDGKIAICNTSGGELAFSKYMSYWHLENRNVALVNAEDFTLHKRIQMPNNYFCPGHIKRNGDTLVVSGIYSYLNDVDFLWDHVNWNPIIIDKDGHCTELIQGSYVNEVMDAEYLSTAVHHEKQIVAMTIPAKNSINIWNLKDQSFLAHINLPLPKGILVNPQTGDFMVATAEGFFTITSDTFQVKNIGLRDVGNGLSHSYIV